MRKQKALFYKDGENAVYKLVKRKSVERKRVLYKAGITDWTYNISYNWKLIKDGMSASEAEAFVKLLGLKLYKRS
jgi:hypothetical protein